MSDSVENNSKAIATRESKFLEKKQHKLYITDTLNQQLKQLESIIQLITILHWQTNFPASVALNDTKKFNI